MDAGFTPLGVELERADRALAAGFLNFIGTEIELIAVDGESSEEHAALRLVSTALRGAATYGLPLVAPWPPPCGAGSWHVLEWKEEYAAAVLICAVDVDEATLHVHVVEILDSWEFGLETSAHKGWASQAVASHRPVHLPVGSVRAQDIFSLQDEFRWMMTEAQRRTGSARSASNRGGGHQHTLAFIEAVIRAAIQSVNEHDGRTSELGPDEADDAERMMPELAPRGGFTDVGRHTGGEARDTRWPLMRAVTHLLLRHVQPPLVQPQVFFELTVARFYMWLVESALAPTEDSCRTLHCDDDTMKLLVAAYRAGAALADSQRVAMTAFMGRCERARAKLDDRAAERAKNVAAEYQLRLPPHAQLTSLLSPQLTPVGVSTEADARGGIPAARAQALLNLQWVPYLGSGATFTQAAAWLASPQFIIFLGSVPAQSMLAEVETLVFDHVARILPIDSSGATAAQCTGAEIDALVLVVDTYRKRLAAFRNTEPGKGLMQTVLVSREVLLVWCTFALIHQSVKHLFKALACFAVALHYTDLEHLVLSDKRALDTMALVCAYLKRTNDPVVGADSVAFSGRPDEVVGTYALADACVRELPDLQLLWAAEQSEAAARQAKRWLVVQEKQRACQVSRMRIDKLKDEIDSAKPEASPTHYKYTSLRYSLSAEEEAYKTAKKPPPAVYQPLPEDDWQGLRAVFLVHMPALLRTVARWSFEAYQVLCPSPVVAPSPRLDGHEFVANHYNPSSNHRAVLGSLHFFTPTPPTVYVGDNVETISSPASGIWHPPSFEPQLRWPQGSRYTNPFLAKRSERVTAFTEALPPAAKSLQWAMVQSGTDTTAANRGNLAVAQQHERPLWLNKPEYLTFCAVRAYPVQQLRKLCVCLAGGLLPLTHEAVHTLVRQTLYHVGCLAPGADGRVTAMWKLDLSEGDALAELARLLTSLASELECAPQRHGAVLLLGEVAAVFAAFDGTAAVSCRTTARKFDCGDRCRDSGRRNGLQ